MNLLTDLGSRLTDRWLLWHGLPGLVYVIAVMIGNRLGYGTALDVTDARSYGALLLVRLSEQPVVIMVAVAVGAVIAATVAAWCATAVSVGVERLMVIRRSPSIFSASLSSVENHFKTKYKVDLPTLWPYLLLQMPQEHHDFVIAARVRIRQTTMLIGWGAMCVALGFVWPVAGAVGLLLGGFGAVRLKRSVASFAERVSAVARWHTPAIASHLGFENTGRLNPDLGRSLQYHLQGDDIHVGTSEAKADTIT